ncbi:MAG TPA: hypothetical protein VGF91_07430 [Solirubrobacteraceae bacterium]|jgi:hypothetical protein
MAQRTSAGGESSIPDPPSQVQVTVVPGPRRAPIAGQLKAGAVRARLGTPGVLASTAIATAAVAAAIIAIAGIAAGTSSHPTRVPHRATATTAVITPTRARNPFLPAYALNVTAIFHQVHGRWHLLRIVSGSECPANVPSEVRSSDLVVCERGPGLRKIP